jgi:hypothetical protein
MVLLPFIMEIYKNAIESYEVSNLGNVRRKKKNGGHVKIKGSVTNRGYKYFQLSRDGKRKNFLFHCLVAKVFIGERPDGLVIDHIDRDKLNNNVSNLRYITQQENCCNQRRYNEDIETKDNKERHRIQCRRYRARNREKNKQRHKKYYEDNKHIMIECACGITYPKIKKYRHVKTKHHLDNSVYNQSP